MNATIDVKHLRKSFGPYTAVSDISFSVRSGEVLGFLGPNGAGKSTTMKMITGFLAPTSGSISVCDLDVGENPIKVKEMVGYLPEGAPAYSDMTPHSFLSFIADIRGFKGEEKTLRVATAIQKANLESVLHKPIDTLSKGFKRRVGIAQAILHDPPVLIMDEPTDGLDPNQKHEVRRLIKEMARDKVIIISTHILEEVEAICTRAIIIAQGKLLFDGTPAKLESLSDYHNAVVLRFAGNVPSNFESAVKNIAGVKEVRTNSQGEKTHFTVIAVEGQSIHAALHELARKSNWDVVEFRHETGHLDDVFRRITTQSSAIVQGALS